MAKFHVAFDVDDKNLGPALLALHPFKVEGLEMRPLVTPGNKGRAGGAPAWQVVADAVHDAGKPLQAKEAAAALVRGGFNKSGVSTHLATAVANKAIRKTAKGYVSVSAWRTGK